MSLFFGGQSSPQHLQRLANSSRSAFCRSYSISDRTITEHDVLFLRQHGAKHAKWHLTAPLRPEARVRLSYGASIPATDLIGRRILDVVRDSAGHSVVLHEPSLASYIINSERLATPIYPNDANTIVSLLDLNPSRPGEDDRDDAAPPFEIFEAGTGMGSLTLHIARALHAANPPFPAPLRQTLLSSPFKSRYDFTTSRGCLEISPGEQSALDAYASSRRAVLHTLDRNSKHARAAYKLVRNFRRAQYLPSVDFHVGSVDEFLSRRLEQTGGQPFLSRAVLDLPSAHENAERVIEALHPNGLLILFKPSISQIADFQAWSAETKQPVRTEKVIELYSTTASEGGVHDSSGGRHWDVKTVVPRAQQGEDGNNKPVQVMRPKVGERVAGGGFVAVFRRWPVSEVPVQEASEEAEAPE
ncbi:trna adenine-n1--methyltransferase [Trichoderma cornu-damae]|uniref:tRNA (adenine(58)-N(1))-methyltransferase catalytic subunit TRM61 n=1 Tax=Trichoderma cornu-damae TaxID=654480 RepID=A0A9P8QF46_9HYPO|nr:trna adenine-n1--methyltransferase [Trichoderma cornu-damae]